MRIDEMVFSIRIKLSLKLIYRATRMMMIFY